MEPITLDQVQGQAIGGWISPDGLFFQARYEEHDYIASQILKYWLCDDRVYLHADYLVEHGWIRLETSGDITHDFDPTQPQIDVLYQLYVRALPGYFYKDLLYYNIAPYVSEVVRVREPMPAVPPQGDQENHRKLYAYQDYR